MIGSEGVNHVEHVLRWRIGKRFGSTALSIDRIPRRLGVDKRELAVVAHGETGNRIVPTVGGKQKSAIRREDDAGRAFKGVGRALLATDRLFFARNRSSG